MALSSIWASLPNERLVGLGYALPWLDRFGTDAERVFAFMPAHARARWTGRSAGPSATALVFDEELPLVDSCDRPHAAGPLARACRESARDAEGDLAGAVAGRPRRHRRAQPARRLGALRAYAFRHRPAVFARPAHRTAARGQFHAARPGPTRCSSRHRSGAG